MNLSFLKLTDKWYRAEVLDINEFREYRASSVDEAAQLAAEEFGEDNIGRVMPGVGQHG